MFKNFGRKIKKKVQRTGKKIKSAVKNFANFIQGIFIREVDYERFMAFDHIDHVDRDITEENFPRSEHEQGIKDIPFKFFRHGKTWQEIIKKMKKKKCRPATLREFLSFIEHPDKIPQRYRRRSIIALGSVYKNRVTVLTITSHSREISLISLDGQWPRHIRFLAVSEKTTTSQ